MELKFLGNTKVKLPEIGLGTWQYQGDPANLKKGVEMGSFMIDTAENYGTEPIVGEAIRNIQDKVFIATKVSGSHLRYDQVIQAAEHSLSRLGVNCIDLYQIHWPDPSVPIRETMKAMEYLVDIKVIKHIGVSNFSTAQLISAQRAMSKYPIVSNQVLYNLNHRGIELELLPYSQDNSITVIAYTPLDDGILALSRPTHGKRNISALETIARDIGKTPAQVALNWCISHPTVIAIPKTDKMERIKENFEASGWSLTKEQINLLNEFYRPHISIPLN